DYVIPGNDDAIRAIKLISSKIAEAILEVKPPAEEGAEIVSEVSEEEFEEVEGEEEEFEEEFMEDELKPGELSGVSLDDEELADFEEFAEEEE
ncbi:MAG: 30S ribosomal protein S2, partial [Armatimonadota bacterium]